MRWASLFFVTAVIALVFPDIGTGQGKKDAKTGEFNSPPAKGERKFTTLRAGEPAPDFTLPDVKKTREVKLSNYKTKRPVVLIFGSYT